jgi:hypothetical protein
LLLQKQEISPDFLEKSPYREKKEKVLKYFHAGKKVEQVYPTSKRDNEKRING